MNDLKRIIANNITNLRKSKNLTQLEFAKELNYSDKAISKTFKKNGLPYKANELKEYIKNNIN